MRIAVNARFLAQPVTGVQRYATMILDRFPRDQVLLLTPFKLDVNQLASLQMKQIRAQWVGLYGHIWEQLVLPQLVKRSLLFSPSNVGPLAVTRQVVTIHDIAPLDHPEWFNPYFAAWYNILIPALVRRVQRVIAVSEFTRMRLAERTGVGAEKFVVIPNGVESRFYPRSSDEVAQIRVRLGLPSAHYVLALSSLEPRKNLHRLLQAWECIQGLVPENVWLVIAGAKGRKLVFSDVSLEKLPPRVYLTGRIPDELLPILYSGAIAFAYVSVYEGFGLPPLEAMASGTPVLTGNLTALPEVVGDAGLMVNPYDVEAIAWGLKRLIEDSVLREELRRKGLERAKRFSWDKTAELTWKVLQEAAQEE